MDVAGGAVTLFGDEQVYGDGFLVLRSVVVVAFFSFVWFVEEGDEVRVLLDGAGFAEVRETGFAAFIFFQFAVELGKNDDRDVQFLGEGFNTVGNHGDFLLTVFDAGRTGVEELEVINDDEFYAVLLIHTAGFGAELKNGEASGVVDIERSIGHFAGGAGELREIALCEKTVTDVAHVHAGAGTEHTQDEGFRGHFQGEDADGLFFLENDVLDDIHDERGFTHGRAGRDDDHFAAMQAAGHFVEVEEAGADASDHALALMIILDGVDGAMDQVLHLHRGGLDTVLADLEDVAFDFVDQAVDFAFVFVNAADHAGAGLDHLPQDMFFADDFDVVIEVRGGRNGVGQGGEVGNAADRFELVLQLQVFLERDDVDRLFRVVHLDQRVENDLVAEVVEDLDAFLEFFEASAEAIVRAEHHATEDTLFGFDGMGRKAIEAGGCRKAGADAGTSGTAFRKIAGGTACVSAVDHGGRTLQWSVRNQEDWLLGVNHRMRGPLHKAKVTGAGVVHKLFPA